MYEFAWHLLLLVVSQVEERPVALEQIEPVAGITFADIAAGYHQNASSFRRPRATWCYVDHKTEAWYETQKATVERYRRLLGRVTDAERKKDLRWRIEQLERIDPKSAEEWRPQDYWADGERVQVRTPWPPELEEREGKKWRFSDDPITSETLATVYREYHILSFDPARPDSLRIWQGILPNHYLSGYTAKTESVDSLTSNLIFPPLLRPRNSEQASSAHPLDRFFQLPEQDMRVLGRMRLGEASVYVVEYQDRKGTKPWSGPSSEGLLSRDTTRAFIDPARGFLPLRIEFGSVRTHLGRVIDAGPILFRIVECQEIKQISEAGFYPTKGTDRHLSADPTDPAFDRELTAERYINETPPKSVTTLDNRWEVLRVTVNNDISDEMFALEFPNGTRYVDSVTNEEDLVGTSDKEFKRMLNAPPPRCTKGSKKRGHH